MAPFRISKHGRHRLGQFTALAGLDDIAHGVTTREGPAFGTEVTSDETSAAANDAADNLGFAGVAYPKQVHGGTVLRVRTPGRVGEADGLVTEVPGLAILGRSADCPLVLAVGRRPDNSPAVGFAHASWRSTVAGITTNLVTKLQDELGVVPASIQAGIAPSAGPCCYEVGDEVRDQAMDQLGKEAALFFQQVNERWHFDLWSANLKQLTSAGVPASQIWGSNVCTICQGQDFWSWRTMGEAAGRFAGLIGVRNH